MSIRIATPWTARGDGGQECQLETIPVVMAASGEPVGTGIVAGLARPGGNITGLSAFTSELFLKRLELLRKMVAGILWIRRAHAQYGEPACLDPQCRELKTVAPSLGLEAQLLDVTKVRRHRARRSTPQMPRAPTKSLWGTTPSILGNRREVVDMAAKHRLPMDACSNRQGVHRRREV